MANTDKNKIENEWWTTAEIADRIGVQRATVPPDIPNDDRANPNKPCHAAASGANTTTPSNAARAPDNTRPPPVGHSPPEHDSRSLGPALCGDNTPRRLNNLAISTSTASTHQPARRTVRHDIVLV